MLRFRALILMMVMIALPAWAQDLSGLTDNEAALVEVKCEHKTLNGKQASSTWEGVVVDARGLVMVSGRIHNGGETVSAKVRVFEKGRVLKEVEAELLFYDRATRHSFLRLQGAQELKAVEFLDSIPAMGNYVYSLSRAKATHQALQPLVLKRALVESNEGLTSEGHRPISRKLSGLIFNEQGRVIGLYKGGLEQAPIAFVSAARVQRAVEKASSGSF